MGDAAELARMAEMEYPDMDPCLAHAEICNDLVEQHERQEDRNRRVKRWRMDIDQAVGPDVPKAIQQRIAEHLADTHPFVYEE